jgi:glycosyltransferase involved in cell wall biosynthesis
MRKKRIGHVTFHYFPVVGGQEVYIDHLMKVLEARGFDNVVYQPTSSKTNFFSKDIDPRVKLIVTIPFLNRYIKNLKKWAFSFFLLTRFFSLLKDDVIIVHYAFHSWPLLLFKKKVIVLSHGVEWDIRYLSLMDKLQLFIARKTFNKFKLVANDTHYLRTLSLAAAPNSNYFSEISPQKWFIPNCISTANFRPEGEAFVQKQGRHYILVPRQITVDRGIDLAIEAFALIAQEYENTDLLIAGVVRDEAYKIQCDNLISRFQLHDRVTWSHSISNAQISNYYRGAQLTLIPTLRREGTSLSALEAMACRCPVVSTNVAGLADLPTLQAAPDKNELSAKLRECINNRDEISKEQFAKVQEIFNEKNWSESWLAVIESTLKN